MPRNPTNWDQYDRGGGSRTGSVSSFGNRSVQFENESPLGRSADSRQDDAEWTHQLRRRRSSITNRLTALTDLGGVNSIRSFTRSWQRAAGFSEVIPQRPSFVFAPDQALIAPPSDEETAAAAGDASPYTSAAAAAPAPTGGPSPSLIRQHLEAAIHDQQQQQHQPPSLRAESPDPGGASYSPLYRHASRDSRSEGKPLLDGASELAAAFRVGSHSGGSIFAIPPHLATPSIVGSYGSAGAAGGEYDYGTVRSDGGSMAQAAALWRQQQDAAADGGDGELAPILVKEVEQDGKIVLAVEGQSTLPQTVFNSTKYVSFFFLGTGVGLVADWVVWIVS
jgi:vesicular inhibitory amino acid transporter